MLIQLDAAQVIVAASAVLWLGHGVTMKTSVLRRFSIPVAVTGGLICSIFAALADAMLGFRVECDMAVRDTLLLAFFSTVGLCAKVRLLMRGGRALLTLAALTLAFLVLQNGLGVALALALDEPWFFGLIGGSVSLAGGHGTAITWGSLAAEHGYGEAIELGLAFATLGLVCGGAVGGPLANFLLRRFDLASGASESETETASESIEPRPREQDTPTVAVTSGEIIRSVLFLAICIATGAEINRLLGDEGIVLPGFLTAMGVGIFLTNLADAASSPVDDAVLEMLGEVALHLFLAMSLMTMQLNQLAGAFGAVFLVLALQISLTVAFAVLVVFRALGRDYDAAVVAAGYAGLALGATPVGVANMKAVTARSGPSAKAFLVVPLVGAFLLDVMNAAVIQAYVGLFG